MLAADTPSPRSVLNSHNSLGPAGLNGALMAEHSPSVTGSDESVLDGLASAYFHAPPPSQEPIAPSLHGGRKLPGRAVQREGSLAGTSADQRLAEIAGAGDPALVLPSSQALGPTTLVCALALRISA